MNIVWNVKIPIFLRTWMIHCPNYSRITTLTLRMKVCITCQSGVYTWGQQLIWPAKEGDGLWVLPLESSQLSKRFSSIPALESRWRHVWNTLPSIPLIKIMSTSGGGDPGSSLIGRRVQKLHPFLNLHCWQKIHTKPRLQILFPR